jgi:hypothetical protein
LAGLAGAGSSVTTTGGRETRGARREAFPSGFLRPDRFPPDFPSPDPESPALVVLLWSRLPRGRELIEGRIL